MSITKLVPSVVLLRVLKGTASRSNGPAGVLAWWTQLPHGLQAQGQPGGGGGDGGHSAAVQVPFVQRSGPPLAVK